MTDIESSIIFVGDVHGHWDAIGQTALAAKGEQVTIIQVGDFGIGFPDHQMGIKESRRLQYLSDTLEQNGAKLLVVKGNHDDPSRFPSKFDHNIEFLPPIDIRMIQGKKHLIVGGAISIDRWMRVPGRSWWAEERIDYEEVVNLSLPDDIDVVVTHSAPLQSPAPDEKGLEAFFEKDDALRAELREERECLTKLCTRLEKQQRKITWVYGHFHETQSSLSKMINFRQLDIDEAWMLPAQ